MEKMDLFMLSSALLSNPLLHPKRQIPKQAYFPEKNGTPRMGTFDLTPPLYTWYPCSGTTKFSFKGFFFTHLQNYYLAVNCFNIISAILSKN